MNRSRFAIALLLLAAGCSSGSPNARPRTSSPSPSPSSASSSSPGTPAPGVTIAAAGDIACDPGSGEAARNRGFRGVCRERVTAALLRKGHYVAVLALGDEQYENGSLADFKAAYDPAWGVLKRITYPAPGNHEYGTPGAAGYYAYFGARAGARSQGYYSFDIGGWHLIALNSNCGAIGGCNFASPQGRWLRADLAAHPSACTLAYWHHPRFSSGPHGNDARFGDFWRILYDGGADVVLVGHDHHYERFAPQTPGAGADPKRGIREFVVGTGGRSHYPFVTPRANSQVRNSTTFGVLALTLRPNGYDWRFVPEPGQSFTDAGTSSCH
jgi:calcineurin-like phosphoesterase family protein